MSADDHDPRVESEDGFLQRWSRRKLRPEEDSGIAGVPQATGGEAGQAGESEIAPAPPVAEPLPPLDSLHEGSDFTAFLGVEVPEELHRLALRRLFQSPKFNVIDGLDDYAEDFSSFAPLGNLITHEWQRALKREQERLAQANAGAQAEPQTSPDTECGSAELAQAAGDAPERSASLPNATQAGPPGDGGTVGSAPEGADSSPVEGTDNGKDHAGTT